MTMSLSEHCSFSDHIFLAFRQEAEASINVHFQTRSRIFNGVLVRAQLCLESHSSNIVLIAGNYLKGNYLNSLRRGC